MRACAEQRFFFKIFRLFTTLTIRNASKLKQLDNKSLIRRFDVSIAEYFYSLFVNKARILSHTPHQNV